MVNQFRCFEKYLKLILTLFISVLMVGCVVREPSQSRVHDAILDALSDSVHFNRDIRSAAHAKTKLNTAMGNALLPPVSVKLPGVSEEDEHRFDVNAVDVPVNKFFMSLVNGTSYNMVVDPDVTGTISLSLKSVTIQESIDAATKSYGLQYQKTAYGYRISTKKLETRIFTLNYLDIDRQGVSKMQVRPSTISDVVGTGGTTSSGSASESSEVKTTTRNNFWTELKATLTDMIGDKDGHKVVVNIDSGVIIIRAYPNELQTVARYFDYLQRIMTRQVILEAKVLEVHLSAKYQSGIQWKYLGLNFDGTQKMDDDLQDPNNLFTIHIKNPPDFSSVINLLNTQGRAEVLSSPRVATLNNQKAIIKVGSDEFFITNVSSTTSGTAAAEVTQNVDFTPFFSGIALDVIPEIDRNDEVTLHIHPIVTTVNSDTKDFTVSGKASSLPLAKSTIRESDTIVHVKNGEVIVLGGLMENTTKSFDGSVPGVDQTVIRSSVGRHDRVADKIELVILLKPIVVKNNTWNDDMMKARDEFDKMKGSFTYTVHRM